jgi:hypothetical protein
MPSDGRSLACHSRAFTPLVPLKQPVISSELARVVFWVVGTLLSFSTLVVISSMFR